MKTIISLLPTSGLACATAADVLPLHTCFKSHDHEYYSPLLYIPTAFEISMCSVSSITGLENFCDPQSYSVPKGVTYPKE
jgi:hypothetical protein